MFPLQIETRSPHGSNDQIAVRFWSEGNTLGDFLITFQDEPTVSIPMCTDRPIKFTSLTEAVNKLWTIRKTDQALIVECNDALVLEYEFDSSDNDLCTLNWSEDIDHIMFLTEDTASKMFRGVGTGRIENYTAT